MSSSSPAPQDEQVKGGRYSLLRQLGEGTQGETFEARDNGHAPPPAAREKKPLQQQWNQYVATARGDETKERVTDIPGVSRDSAAERSLTPDALPSLHGSSRSSAC